MTCPFLLLKNHKLYPISYRFFITFHPSKYGLFYQKKDPCFKNLSTEKTKKKAKKPKKAAYILIILAKPYT